MTAHDLIRLWRNAVRILGQPNLKAKLKTDAKTIINDINREWTRRSALNLSEEFKWPSVQAYGGNGRLTALGWEVEGVLKYMGYQVGAEGEPQRIRELMLDVIFLGQIPPVFPKTYLDEWGVPSSVLRLKKMAETIAALTRNGKRRHDARMTTAIRDWERDLDYLYCKYYCGHFHFGWPDSSI